MQDLDLSKIKNVHFIGIGGIGISAIARMMIHDGKKVTGQDMQDSDIISELKNAGAYISIGQSFEAIPKDTDLIVYTIAIEIHDQNLFKKIKEQKDTKVFSYPQMLHIVSEGKYTIAVSGTHGKTTTTGMIAQILQNEGKDPTVIIGSLLRITQKDKNNNDSDFNSSNMFTNFVSGSSKYFLVESCEYRRSFLNINPKILIITNIDEDHLDYYKDIEDIKSAFRELVMKVPGDGFIVCDPDDKNIKDVISGASAKIVNYQDFFDKNQNLKIPGIHNKKNAAAACAVANLLSISKADSDKDLSLFLGTWRRFEYKGKLANGTLIYDDYAHHPAEIVATLSGFRELYPSEKWRITVVFQPHLFSRTKLLFDDFAKSFSLSDEVILLPIYFAREENDESISSEILSSAINKNNTKAKSFKSFQEAQDYLDTLIKNMSSNDIIVTMGAGEAFKIADNLLKQ